MILHADVDAFFAAVEQRDDPSLRGRPVVVGAGVVMAASYEARAYGVRGAMGGRRARSLCPDLVTVPPRFDAYVEASRAVFAAFRAEVDDVAGASMEEAFLRPPALGAAGTAADAAAGGGARTGGSVGAGGSPGVGGSVGAGDGTWVGQAGANGGVRAVRDAREAGSRVRARVREETGLTVTVGGGSTRLVAKMAGRTVKPDGLRVLAAAEELPFLHALAVEDVWGIGAATAAKLHHHGLCRLGDLAGLDRPALMAMFGKATGRALHAQAHNLPAPVRRHRGRRSVGAQSAIRRTGWSDDLDAVLVRLTDRVVGRLRKGGHAGRTLVLRLRFGDFEQATRSRSLAHPVSTAEPLLVLARALLAQARPEIERRALTLVGLTVTNLGLPGIGEQLTLEG